MEQVLAPIPGSMMLFLVGWTAFVLRVSGGGAAEPPPEPEQASSANHRFGDDGGRAALRPRQQQLAGEVHWVTMYPTLDHRDGAEDGEVGCGGSECAVCFAGQTCPVLLASAIAGVVTWAVIVLIPRAPLL